MDVDIYSLSALAEARLGELRAERQRIALLQSLRAPRRPFAARLGTALVRTGQWLAGESAVPAGRADQRPRDWRRSAGAV